MRRAVAIGALALACLPLGVQAAGAAYDPVGSGATRLTFDRAFLGLLKQNDVKLSAIAPARVTGGTATFPLAGGKFDPVTAKGTLDHDGAIRLTSPAGSIPLKALQLKTTQRRSPFSAKVGGSQLRVAMAKGLSVTREGFGEKITVSGLSIGAKLATRLGKKLGLRGIVKEGQPLGSTVTRAQPQTISVLGEGKAVFSFDPGFLAKLDHLFVAVNPIFPAERPVPAFTLPIFGGTIAPDGSTGGLETQGALELLQLGGGQVFWKEPWIDLADGALSAEAEALPSPPFAGKAGRAGVAGLGLSGAAVSADPRARTVTVDGASLTLGAETATTLNDVFAKPQGKQGVFAAGEALGSASFVAQGQ